MNWQALLLEPAILAALAGGRSGLLANRNGSAAGILMILAACLAGVAVLAFLGAGYVWLQSVYGAQYATLVTGLAMLGLAALSSIAAWGIVRYKRVRIAAYQREVTSRIEAVAQAILTEIGQPVKAYPKTALSLAALVGYVAGDRIQDGTGALLGTFEKMRLNGTGRPH